MPWRILSENDTWEAWDVLEHLYCHGLTVAYGANMEDFTITEDFSEKITSMTYQPTPTELSLQIANSDFVLERFEGNYINEGAQGQASAFAAGGTTYPWHAPEGTLGSPGTSDPQNASDQEQFFECVHNQEYTIDSLGRLTEIIEDSGARVTSLTYSGNEEQPVSGTVEVAATSGTISQSFDYDWGTDTLDGITLTGSIVTPDWATAQEGQPFGSSAIRQMVLPHNLAATYDVDGSLYRISEDSGAKTIYMSINANFTIGGVVNEISYETAGTLETGKSFGYDSFSRLVNAG